MTSARRPSKGGRDGGSDDEDRDNDLYSRYISAWRPDANESARSSVRIAGVPKVTRAVLYVLDTALSECVSEHTVQTYTTSDSAVSHLKHAIN